MALRLALAQLNFTVGAFDDNFRKIASAVAQAAEAGADLVVFTELALTGYPPRDLLTHERFVDRNLDLLDRVAALSTDRLAIIVGYVDRNPGTTGKALYNAAALCRHGRVVERRYKALLPTYDIFDEDRYFEPAREVAPVVLDHVRIGLTICEDVWNDEEFWPKRLYHRDPVSELGAAGVDLFINISASPFTLDRSDLRRRMIRREAVQHGRHFFYVNQVGGNDEIVFDGCSIGIGPDGEDVVRAASFAEDLVVYDVETGGAAERTSPAPVLREATRSVEEAAWRALVLGTRDYAAKCGFSHAVLGLSGGIDSALTAAIAVEAFGRDRVQGVALPTRFSSDASLADADALARALGMACRVIPIDSIYQSYLDALAPVFDGLEPDATEENIQARVRGAVLMAISNKSGAILLTTGNKSELAVGYCTLYGDMCGGLAVISDVPKLLVYRLARYVNRERVVIPESTLTRPPSAELGPNQFDTDTLPPYEVLDPIIAAYVENGLDLDAIVAGGVDRTLAADVVRRIDASEYKRRQMAPGIRISSKAFGVGRRYPIAANYGFTGGSGS